MVITRFDCRSLLNMAIIARMHVPLKRQVKRQIPGFRAVKLVPLWRARSILSVSLWDAIPSLYGMGEVQAHVAASRIPTARDMETRCGVFTYEGDWRNVLFGDGWSSESPLS